MKAITQKAAKCMGKVTVSVQELIHRYEPNYCNDTKQDYYTRALGYHKDQKGYVKISRWTMDRERKSPLEFELHNLNVVTDQHYYTYNDQREDCKAWWVNFADPDLFAYYDGDLFAQDEIQCLEHPLLASVREFIIQNNIAGLEPYTVTKNEVTPVLVQNVPWWIQVDTCPTLKDGTTESIYGRNFTYASKEAIEKGLSVIQRDARNNIIAMAAPACGRGEYTEDQLCNIMATVIVAFSGAAKIATEEKIGSTVIHTGNWGCGAFGNDFELMYLCQILGASLAGVEEIVFHKPDHEKLEAAMEKYKAIGNSNLIQYLKNQHYKWRTGDGN